MMLYLILGIVTCVLFGGALAWWKIRQASQEIDRLFKANQVLETEKTVRDTQIKHFEVRKKNEQNTRRNSRDDIIDRLQQQGDLRD